MRSIARSSGLVAGVLILALAGSAAAGPVGDAHLPLAEPGMSVPPAAQNAFDEGLDLLHCFWDFEAARSFQEAAEAAPNRALPQLGLWLALGPNAAEKKDERQAALTAAIANAQDESERVQQLVAAYAERAGGGSAEDFEASLRQLIALHPDQQELVILLVRELVLGVTGHVPHHGGGPAAPLGRAEKILDGVLASSPEDVAARHYHIHIHELLGDPEGAVESAEVLRRRQPDCGHLRHMPGHVDYLLGDYDRAREAFLDAHEFDTAYLGRSGVSPLDHWNYVHNMTYLVSAATEAGRVAEARKFAAELATLPVSPHRDMSLGLGYVVYGGLTSLARVNWRMGDWSGAAAALETHLEGPELPSREAGAYLVGLLAYFKAREALEEGQLEEYSRYSQALLNVTTALTQRQATLGSDWYFEPGRRVLALAAVELDGVAASVAGDHMRATQRLEQARLMEAALGYAEPPHYPVPVAETYGDILSKASRWTEAVEAYEAALEKRPNSAFAWIGIAKAQKARGDSRAAELALEKARAAWRAADPAVRTRIPVL